MLNNLISPCRIKLAADTEYQNNNGAVAKSGEIYKADREVPFSGGRDVTPLVGPVIRTDRGVEGEVRSLEVAAEYSGL